jgi:VanZ family protein
MNKSHKRLDINRLKNILPVKMTFIRYHLPIILYAALIFMLSSISKIPEEIPAFDFSDKLIHFFEFALFGWLLRRSALKWKTKTESFKFWFILLIIGAVYAASDELHQLLVPGRFGSIFDWLADIIGLAAGLSTAYIYDRKKAEITANMGDKSEKSNRLILP